MLYITSCGMKQASDEKRVDCTTSLENLCCSETPNISPLNFTQHPYDYFEGVLFLTEPMCQARERWWEKMSLKYWKSESFYEWKWGEYQDGFISNHSICLREVLNKKAIVPQTWKSVFERAARKLFKWMGIQNTQNDFTDSALAKMSKKINVVFRSMM